MLEGERATLPGPVAFAQQFPQISPSGGSQWARDPGVEATLEKRAALSFRRFAVPPQREQSPRLLALTSTSHPRL